MSMPIQPETLLARLLALPIVGRAIAPRGALQCVVCRRRNGAMGRLLAPGWPACADPQCEMVPTREVHALFAGRYGAALTRSNLQAWGEVLDIGGRVLTRKTSLTARREDLVARFCELLAWQAAFDHWERWRDVEGWRAGKVRHIPPRRIEDVAALRAYGPLAPRSPVEGLPSPDREEIDLFYALGVEAAERQLGLPGPG
jgi:hypothetical protein